ncbi:MAG: type II toxin-antitoxin system VapC family toxin [Desulfobacteraceae bacterium]|nr:type II toxin-antitoxin system VapC family toxin [Pseudomonadota bacterium]MBU4463538.1 type II toxin-antitoxin system VapC family toxin [Pseudomonadota bacterium]MCG2755836.1 type II toxin-antitoxin system VapC family toxin [Desulfobacteraceae bacterium]
MNIVDSSGWLAYFADEPNAKHFLTPLNDTDSLVVPTVTIYEVFKVVLRESSENEALQAAVAMQKGRVVDLTASMAIAASKISLEHKIPMADSIILATAKEFEATIWTQDSDFKNIDDVKYFPKK